MRSRPPETTVGLPPGDRCSHQQDHSTGQGSGKAVDSQSELRAQGYTASGQIHPQGLFSKLLCLMPLVSRAQMWSCLSHKVVEET